MKFQISRAVSPCFAQAEEAAWGLAGRKAGMANKAVCLKQFQLSEQRASAPGLKGFWLMSTGHIGLSLVLEADMRP